MIVFGGTSGIGFCIAEAALENGARVLISGSNPERLVNALERLKSTFPSQKDNIQGLACDLADPVTLEQNIVTFLETATSSLLGGKIDHIAFTAGDALKFKPLSETDVDHIHSMGLVRFIAPAILAKHISKHLNPGPSSSFTLTSGSNSEKPGPGWSVLAGYGSAVEGLMRGLAVDLALVRVNVVSPGAVHTELFDKIPFENREEVLAGYKRATLTGKLGRPEHLAESYLYPMRDQFLTGTVIHSNGGRFLA